MNMRSFVFVLLLTASATIGLACGDCSGPTVDQPSTDPVAAQASKADTCRFLLNAIKNVDRRIKEAGKIVGGDPTEACKEREAGVKLYESAGCTAKLPAKPDACKR
jgi:hypothetical protein